MVRGAWAESWEVVAGRKGVGDGQADFRLGGGGMMEVLGFGGGRKA